MLGVGLDHPGLKPLHDDDRSFIEHLAAVGEFLAECLELAPRRAASHAQDHPAFAHRIEHGGLFDHPQRIVPRQDDGGRHQLDGLGLGRNPCQRLDRVRAGGIVGEMVFDDADPIEAHRFGLDADLDFLSVKILVRNAVQVLERKVDADLH